MKKSVAGAIVMVLGGSCAAQSTVSMYGIVDTGFSVESGGVASVTKVTGGIASGSRLGFKGTEDLGGGLSAQYLMEAGVNVDTGASGQGGILFGRQIYVGIGSQRTGTITLGRQYSPQYLTTVLADPFVSGTAGDSKNLIQAAGSVGRMDNSVKYVSPTVAGFGLELAYAAGEVAGDDQAGRQLGLAVTYAAGPLAARWAYHTKNNDTPTTRLDNTRNMLAAATWTFPAAKLHAAYGINKGPFSSPLRNAANPFGRAVVPTAVSLTHDSHDALFGVTAPFGPHTLLASVIHKNDRTAADQDATQLAAGYRYALSRRTDLYAVIAHIRNRNGAAYTVGNATEGGTGNRAWNAGLRHVF